MIKMVVEVLQCSYARPVSIWMQMPSFERRPFVQMHGAKIIESEDRIVTHVEAPFDLVDFRVVSVTHAVVCRALKYA